MTGPAPARPDICPRNSLGFITDVESLAGSEIWVERCVDMDACEEGLRDIGMRGNIGRLGT